METSVSLLERLAGAPTDDDWRRLDDLYRPLLRAWVARAGVLASDVDDLVQDVLLVAFREIAGFEWRGQGAFRAWLGTILSNQVRDYFRRQKYRPTATGDSDDSRGPLGDDLAADLDAGTLGHGRFLNEVSYWPRGPLMPGWPGSGRQSSQ
jgi:DNA-directed RNA polymerase specialized sigma24 family protein